MNSSRASFILIGPEDKARLLDCEAGLAPRLDYRLVAGMLKATIVECAPPPSAFQGAKPARLLRSLTGNLRTAWSLVQQIPDDSIIYATGETWGIPVALARAFRPGRLLRHAIYVHRVFSPAWLRFLRTTRRWLAVDGWICVTQQQARHLRAALGPQGAPVTVISQGVDSYFFNPEKAAAPLGPPYLLSVGVEMRNYELLFEAVRSLDIDVIMKASSAWMAGGRSQWTAIPSNVKVITGRLSYVELRELYAGAALVVVPLHETLQAAGITTILEAMAMNRPVLATRSAGLPDLLINGQTGVITKPTAGALKHAIAEMLITREQRDTLARNGRQAVELNVTLEQHARQIVDFLALTGMR